MFLRCAAVLLGVFMVVVDARGTLHSREFEAEKKATFKKFSEHRQNFLNSHLNKPPPRNLKDAMRYLYFDDLPTMPQHTKPKQPQQQKTYNEVSRARLDDELLRARVLEDIAKAEMEASSAKRDVAADPSSMTEEPLVENNHTSYSDEIYVAAAPAPAPEEFAAAPAPAAPANDTLHLTTYANETLTTYVNETCRAGTTNEGDCGEMVMDEQRQQCGGPENVTIGVDPSHAKHVDGTPMCLSAESKV